MIINSDEIVQIKVIRVRVDEGKDAAEKIIDKINGDGTELRGTPLLITSGEEQ